MPHLCLETSAMLVALSVIFSSEVVPRCASSCIKNLCFLPIRLLAVLDAAGVVNTRVHYQRSSTTWSGAPSTVKYI